MTQPPSQRARNAAADFILASNLWTMPRAVAGAVRAGDGDMDKAPIVQAFATFEANLKAEMVARAERLIGAVEELLLESSLVPLDPEVVEANPEAKVREALAVIREN